jgi:hypothetical protein
MAITNDTTDPWASSEVDFVSVDVALFENTVVSNLGFNLSGVAANKAYVAGMICYWGVEVAFDGPDAYETYNMAESDYSDPTLRISSDAVTFQSAKAYESFNNADYTTGAWVKLDTAKNRVVDDVVFGANYFANDVSFMVFGSALVKKQGVIKAELYKAQELVSGTAFQLYDGTKATFKVTETEVDADTSSEFLVEDKDGNAVTFVLGTGTRENKVDHIFVQLNGGAEYEISTNEKYGPLNSKTAAKALIAADGTVIDVDAGTGANYLATAGANWTFFQKVMDFFGFSLSLDGYLREDHFLAKSNALYLKDEVAVQLANVSIVVPGDVVPPKTGDAASIVGFVMIAVAMIAAGVVVSKKVRA